MTVLAVGGTDMLAPAVLHLLASGVAVVSVSRRPERLQWHPGLIEVAGGWADPAVDELRRVTLGAVTEGGTRRWLTQRISAAALRALARGPAEQTAGSLP